jgi:hypothetical protein
MGHISRLAQKVEPTVGFEPTTRCLQIRRQLNSARNFSFPCIPRMSAESKEFHSGGYSGGYKTPAEMSHEIWHRRGRYLMPEDLHDRPAIVPQGVCFIAIDIGLYDGGAYVVKEGGDDGIVDEHLASLFVGRQCCCERLPV